MTTVKWLEEQYIKHSGNLLEMGKAFKQAKEMEKEQIIDFAENWSKQILRSDRNTNIQQYYNETFKSE
jgi:hypothetical protein